MNQSRTRMLHHVGMKCHDAPEEVKNTCVNEMNSKLNKAANTSAIVASTMSKASIFHAINQGTFYTSSV